VDLSPIHYTYFVGLIYNFTLTETDIQVGFYDFYAFLKAQMAAVKAEVVILSVLPVSAGVIFIIFCSVLIDGSNLLLDFFLRFTGHFL